MSIDDRIASDQPKSFKFTAENEKEIKRIIAKYPKGRQASAVMPLLDLAQRQHDNWIPMAAIEAIAVRLDMAEIRVLEVATFYTMFNLKPVGKYFLQACTTTPCWLRGSDEMMRCIKDRYGIASGQTSDCGRFSLLEVECLGACVNAPILQVNDDFYEDLDYQTTGALLDSLEADAPLPVGSVVGRSGSEASGGGTTLAAVKSGKSATSTSKKRGSAHA
ncbi:MAG: NADH-quinone oxidoreductase subunit NuoE [Candidatus Puniceispirillaceae bacterium]|jgi:NADH-quinone oxidoreductase E subunit|nr:NADH-quinone oxidoreductase subunit NuoE [Candidatus Puniceispirillum sp.]MCH1426027.1 NADH-quinone oxidoreductase subunit NuoE [Alphaproteobacteria bacterium]MDB2528232.1 NADH-quinone oxidoreductase subunit NuoE [Alphaproteobacteria bacterium]